MTRIVIVDDHPIVRVGLRALLETEADLEVVAEAASEDEAVAACASHAPDVVLMDLRLGEGSGVGAIARIREAGSAPPILVLTNHDADADILAAVEAGAAGYLLKDAPPSELLPAVRAAAAGESALAPAVAARLLQRLRAPLPTLSLRELEVLGLVGEGCSNTQIAQRLHVTEATVKSHLVHVFTKLGVSSRTAAVAEARRSGMLE
ncbi:DNA-binding response regulator [Galactobacter valiniphilus]|uniref:DNA-binding response regulator n=1 Tax=Galactobacter valiniphilus TaxID=2676122 RepID=A0A399J7L9_9MICC|nr:response regulator transcription factor [Galactobacter valiniphilus]RII41120.1 DNA-binding response regulator [Galactobacter valiniphilus]